MSSSYNDWMIVGNMMGWCRLCLCVCVPCYVVAFWNSMMCIENAFQCDWSGSVGEVANNEPLTCLIGLSHSDSTNNSMACGICSHHISDMANIPTGGKISHFAAWFWEKHLGPIATRHAIQDASVKNRLARLLWRVSRHNEPPWTDGLFIWPNCLLKHALKHAKTEWSLGYVYWKYIFYLWDFWAAMGDCFGCSEKGQFEVLLNGAAF